jgi:hypothetical protein
LALISDLHAKLFIDLPPGQRVDDLSLEALVDLAKRAACGPRSWLTFRHRTSNVAREVVLNRNPFPPDFRAVGTVWDRT